MPKGVTNKRSSSTRARETVLKPLYTTKQGAAYHLPIEEFTASSAARNLKGKVDLIFTSPPFPLASPKAYGNLAGEEYLLWVTRVVKDLVPLLKPSGSLVIEIGNAWDKGRPTMSTLPLRTLLAIAEQTDLFLCQQFVWENSARLPGPATWVNKQRIRIKDSHTNIWWYSPSEFPLADNRQVLSPYSPAMERLIRTGKYNPGKRPSEHVVSDKHFARNNSGAIPGSTFIMGNTSTDSSYSDWCKSHDLALHPARMPIKIPEFFIKFLTKPGGLVLDPFSGSNTTGQAAEALTRRWVAVEQNLDYLEGSRGRFCK
jgi:site-specific DNA-methyltransferase (cytosine-N4-specific)